MSTLRRFRLTDQFGSKNLSICRLRANTQAIFVYALSGSGKAITCWQAKIKALNHFITQTTFKKQIKTKDGNV